MKYNCSLRLVFAVLAILICSGRVIAQEIVHTEYGNVFVISFKEYIENDSIRASCKKLPRVINYKAFQSQDNHNFTKEEYRLIAGEALYLGLQGYDYWYDRKAQKFVGWDQLFDSYGAFKSGNWDKLPILCGAEVQPKPKAVKTTENKKSVTDYNDLNEYILHQADGFRTMSSFYSSGSQWCSHPYVRVVVEYDNKTVRQSVLASNPATYLQQTIIPEIKKICPKFPHAALYNKQVIDFRFRPKQGGIADERINPDRLGFNIDDQGQVKLTKDLAYRNWNDANKGSYAFEQENHNNTNRTFITGVETLMKAVNVAIQKIEKPLKTALQRREDYQQFFANTANPIFFEALNLNEDAIAYFNSALTQNKKALSSLKNAHSQYSDPSGSKSSLEKGAQYMEDFNQYRKQAKSFEEIAWDKAIQGDNKVKEGYQEVLKQREQQ